MTDTTPTSPDGEPTPGAYDPATGGTAGAAGAYGTGDPATETLPEPKRGPGKGVVIGIGATVLAVIAGAAVYATTALSGGGRQPDELAPKSSFAYAKIDLDPAANQKLATREFLGKFPKLKEKTGAGDENPFEALLEAMFEGEEDVSYDTDIKPWFDKRAAVAGFRSTDGPTAVGIFQSKDDGKARTAMGKLAAEAKEDGEEFAWKIDDGYVVVGDTQAHVDDAIAQAKKESIKKNTTFTQDLERLGGDQVAVGWVDIRSAFDLVKDQVPDAGLIPNAITDQIKGRMVAGLHMNGDYAEVSGYALGMEQQGVVPQAGDPALLKNLPAGTVAAVSVQGLAEQVKNGLSQLSALGMDAQEFVGPFLQELGLSLEGDVLPLLGDQTVVALGEVPTSPEEVAAGLVSVVKDPTAAKTDGAKLAAALQQMGLPVKADVSGSTFYLATENYLNELKSGKGLGGSEKFTKAMGDLGSVSLAAYVDLETVIPAFANPSERADVAALKSVGIVSGYDKGVGFFRLRVVAL